MIRLPPRSTQSRSSAASDVYKRQEYGTTVTLPDWVIPEVYRMTQAPLVCYKKAYWWGHQDLYILKKI